MTDDPWVRLAFATSEEAATLTAIDLATEQAVAALPAGPGAHAMALTPDGTRLFVANRQGKSLTLVDARTPAVLDTIALSADPIGVAASPDGRRLAVLGRTVAVAWILDTASGAVTHQLPLGTEGEEAPPPAPEEADIPAATHPVWARDGAAFYAEDNRRIRIVRIDADRGLVTAALPLPSIAHMLYLDAPTRRLFALCAGYPPSAVPPSVAIFDLPTHTLIADVPIPLAAGESGELHHAAFDINGRCLFVANMGQGRPRTGRSVHVLDTAKLRLVARLEAPAGAGHPILSPDRSRLFVVSHADPVIGVFDARLLTPIAEIPLPGAQRMGHGCFFAKDGRRFWCISAGAGAAYAIDTATLRLVAQIPIGPESQDIIHHWRDAYA